MSERYKQVKLYDSFKFCPTCPVDILKGAIYIDNVTNKAVFQLKFINMQDKNIKAIYVQIKGSNDLEQELENKEYQYLDLSVNKGQEFGTERLQELDNNTIRNIEITINKIIYADNEIWENKNTVSYDRTNLQYVDNSMLFIARGKATEQRLQLNNIYYPFQNEKYWTCVCGTYNSNNNDKCYKCNCSKDLVFREFSKDKIESDFTNYNKHKQNKNNIKKNIYQKLLKLFIILFILSILIGIFAYNIQKTDVLITLNKSLTNEQEQNIKTQIGRICNTTDIQYISKDEALEIMKEKLGDEWLKYYEGSNNIFPNQYKVQVKLSKSPKIVDELMNIKGVKNVTGNNKTTNAIMSLVIFSILGILLLCIIVIRVKIYWIDKNIKK